MFNGCEKKSQPIAVGSEDSLSSPTSSFVLAPAQTLVTSYHQQNFEPDISSTLFFHPKED